MTKNFESLGHLLVVSAGRGLPFLNSQSFQQTIFFEVKAGDRLVTWQELTWTIDCFVSEWTLQMFISVPRQSPLTVEGGRHLLTFLLLYFYLVVYSQFYIFSQQFLPQDQHAVLSISFKNHSSQDWLGSLALWKPQKTHRRPMTKHSQCFLGVSFSKHFQQYVEFRKATGRASTASPTALVSV